MRWRSSPKPDKVEISFSAAFRNGETKSKRLSRAAAMMELAPCFWLRPRHDMDINS